MLLPKEHFVNAVTWGATIFQVANATGPMVGGFLFTVALAKAGALAHWNGAPVEHDSITVLTDGRQHAASYPDDLACAVHRFRATPALAMAELAQEAALPRAATQEMRLRGRMMAFGCTELIG